MKSKQFSRFGRKQGLKHWTSRAHTLAHPVLKQIQICLFHSSSVSRPGSKVTPLILPEVPQFEALSQDSGHTMSGSINKGPNACTPGGPPMRFPRDVSPSKMGCKLGVPKK